MRQPMAVQQEANRALILFAPRPIHEIIHPERVEIYQDSTQRIEKFDMHLDTADPRQIILTFEKLPGKKYRIVLPDSLTRDYLGVYNKQSELLQLTYPEEQIGKLKLAVKRNNADINYLLEIRSKTGLVKSIAVGAEPSSVYSVGELEAGEYSIEIIEDENKNGVWDTGNFLLKRQPEKKYVYDKKIQLKGNWELDFEIILN